MTGISLAGMALAGQPPVPAIRLGAEAKRGKEKGELETKAKDGDGRRAVKQEVPEGAREVLTVPPCK